MSDNPRLGSDRANQFRNRLLAASNRFPIDTIEIERIVKIGLEALSNKTLQTVEDGSELLGMFLVIGFNVRMSENYVIQLIKELFEILIVSGASHKINVSTRATATPLIRSIQFNAPIIFNLLLSCPSIDLNATSWTNWTPLMTAIHYSRTEMVETLCKRFYDIDFNVATGSSNTALMMTDQLFYSSHPIKTLVHTAVNVDLPQYKNSVNNLLLHHFPNVLIPVVGLYTFF